MIGFVFAGWLLHSLPVHGNTTESALLARAENDLHTLGEFLWKYAEEHDGKLPSSVSELRAIGASDPPSENIVLLMPGAVLRDLPAERVVAVRTVWDRSRWVEVVLRATLAIGLRPAPRVYPPKSDSGPLLAIAGCAAVILWIKRRGQPGAS